MPEQKEGNLHAHGNHDHAPTYILHKQLFSSHTVPFNGRRIFTSTHKLSSTVGKLEKENTLAPLPNIAIPKQKGQRQPPLKTYHLTIAEYTMFSCLEPELPADAVQTKEASPLPQVRPLHIFPKKVR